MRLISAIAILMGAITLFAVLSPYVLPIVRNRNLWAAVSLIAILLFTSGQMFNHIRKVPYVAGDGHGGISYFAGGFQNQFGMETQIVAAICKFGPFSVGVGATVLTFLRCRSLLCNNRACIESPTDGGCQGTASRCVDLGGCSVHHVQSAPQCFQDQEWRLSVLPPSILGCYLRRRHSSTRQAGRQCTKSRVASNALKEESSTLVS